MRTRQTIRLLAVAFALLASVGASAQDSGVLGYWKEPTGSVIHIDHCGADICATLVALRPTAPSRVDVHNPDRRLQSRSLCGLQIGQGFHLASANRADGGTLYDPKSGKTYRGTMTSEGDRLNLRGYVGLPMFGRSETWTRTTAVETCKS